MRIGSESKPVLPISLRTAGSQLMVAILCPARGRTVDGAPPVSILSASTRKVGLRGSPFAHGESHSKTRQNRCTAVNGQSAAYLQCLCTVAKVLRSKLNRRTMRPPVSGAGPRHDDTVPGATPLSRSFPRPCALGDGKDTPSEGCSELRFVELKSGCPHCIGRLFHP